MSTVCEKQPLHVSPDGLSLYPQNIGGEIALYDNEYLHSIRQTPLVRRERKHTAGSLTISIFYSTENPDKFPAMRSWIKEQLQRDCPGVAINFREKMIDVPEESAAGGAQPYFQFGISGAVWRSEHIERLSVDSPSDAVFCLSVESSLNGSSAVHDQPNFYAVELCSGRSIGARGRGPFVQPELLALALADGFTGGGKLCGNTTYGQVVKKNFGISSSDWQSVVTKGRYGRTPLIEEMLNQVKLDVRFLAQ